MVGLTGDDERATRCRLHALLHSSRIDPCRPGIPRRARPSRQLRDDRCDDACTAKEMRFTAFRHRKHQAMMLATTPAPTVRPPSRMAKRSFSSMAIGVISSTVIVTLSPGITISVPSGSLTMPVTSVVRK